MWEYLESQQNLNVNGHKTAESFDEGFIDSFTGWFLLI